MGVGVYFQWMCLQNLVLLDISLDGYGEDDECCIPGEFNYVYFRLVKQKRKQGGQAL